MKLPQQLGEGKGTREEGMFSGSGKKDKPLREGGSWHDWTCFSPAAVLNFYQTTY